MELLFGDLHNHCGMTYGFGSLSNTMENALSHLDFAAATGHAFWPDIPQSTPETEYLVAFHQKGFQKLRDHYEEDKAIIESFNRPGSFTSFFSYEMHSHRYGDHHLVSGDRTIPLLTEAATPREFFEATKGYEDTIIIPHHIAYTPGYRGISWKDYDESLFPVVEVISKHGCSMSDRHPIPYYHNMGGRDSRNTVLEGLKQGHRFGFVGSTDHHAGYPGSYGDGLVAVLAEENTRSSIMEALKARRTYALNGDRIRCSFTVDGNLFGSIVKANGKRHTLSYKVELSSFLDKLVLFRNGKPFHIVNGELLEEKEGDQVWKIRLEFGWGGRDRLNTWDFTAEAEGGEITALEKCFRGKNVLSPREGETVSEDCNRIENRATLLDGKVEGRVQTIRNQNPTSPATSGVILTVRGTLGTKLHFSVNGKTYDLAVQDLLGTSLTFQNGLSNGPNFKVHEALPESLYSLEDTVEDEAEGPVFYHLEVYQKNGSLALVSPVFFS